MQLPSALEPIRAHVDAMYPLLYLLSWEEARVAGHLMLLASELKPPRLLYAWSITEGYSGHPDGPGVAANDPLAAIDFAIGSTEPALFVLKDFHYYPQDDLRVRRRLREAFQSLQGTGKTIILLDPILAIPTELEKEITVLDYPLPEAVEANQILVDTVETIEPGALSQLDEKQGEALLRAFLGLTGEEIAAVARKILLRKKNFDASALDEVIEEKRNILRKSEILEFVINKTRIKQVGGLNNFKRWARLRANGFTKEARAFGLPTPKGVLITGISGCGKSLVIQALADLWQLPLLRLDMGRVFSGFAGTPEESLRRAIMTVEAVAPAVLWIDEIEMGVSVFSDSIQSGSTSRIFASFLTWMQEKKAPVFIAATANDIDRLPPEFIRKGRFDEVFFVDLPKAEERAEIIRIHLGKRGKRASDVSIEGLTKSTEGYTGAEIEQAIVTAMFESFGQSREMEINDIYRSLGNMVPLSVTMKEQITKQKRWADNRAVRAS